MGKSHKQMNPQKARRFPALPIRTAQNQAPAHAQNSRSAFPAWKPMQRFPINRMRYRSNAGKQEIHRLCRPVRRWVSRAAERTAMIGSAYRRTDSSVPSIFCFSISHAAMLERSSRTAAPTAAPMITARSFFHAGLCFRFLRRLMGHPPFPTSYSATPNLFRFDLRSAFLSSAV